MKLKIFSLLLLIFCMTQAPAMAQNRGARFTFAPNYYKTESHPSPRSAWRGPQPQIQPRVAHGHVPKSSSFLGVSPSMLTRPAPAARPPLTRSTTSIAIRAPKTNATYKKHFGEPAALIAHQSPAIAAPKSFSAKPAVKATLKKSTKSAKSVSAKRIASKKHAPQAKVAKANHIKGYGNNFYTAGGHTPASSGSAASTSVRGTVLQRHR